MIRESESETVSDFCAKFPKKYLLIFEIREEVILQHEPLQCPSFR